MALPPDEVSDDMFDSGAKRGKQFGSNISRPQAPANAFATAFGKKPPKSAKPAAATVPAPSPSPALEDALMAQLGFTSFGKRAPLNAGGHLVLRPGTEVAMTVEEQHERYRTTLTMSGAPETPMAATETASDEPGPPAAPGLPLTHHIELKGHTKPLGALALNRTGCRLITAGWDSLLRFWNFAGMTRSLQPYNEIDPMGEFHGAYTFNQIEYTHDGSKIVLCRAHSQPLLLSMEGQELFEFAKGDQYVAEMGYTKGHTAEVTGCQFSPVDPVLLLTAGKDSTLRLWDLPRVQYRNAEVIKTAHGLARGRKAPVTACAWSLDGQTLFGGTNGGALLAWPVRGPFKKPALSALGCHAPQTNITAITATTPHHVVSRGDDGTVKLWDLRKLTAPVCEHGSLETIYEHCDVALSPDRRHLITGTSVPKTSPSGGQLVVLAAATLQPVATVPLPPGCSAIRLVWHPELNQVAVGCSDGVCRVYYDPRLSRKGALLCATKHKKVAPDGVGPEGPGDIKTPHALPLFREDSAKALHRRYRQAYAPDKSGLASMQEETAAQRPSLKHEMLKEAGIAKNPIRSEDPVAALRAVATEAKEQPLYISPMYLKTQPVPIFAEAEVEAHPVHGSAEEQAVKKRRRLEELRESGAMTRITR